MESQQVQIIDPLLDDRWDQFVDMHENGWLCHLSGWKVLLEKTFPHIRGYYFAAFSEDGQKINAALPVFEVKSLLTGNRLVAAPYASLFDPLYERDTDLQRVLNSIILFSKDRKIPAIQLRSFKAEALNSAAHFKPCCRYFNHYIQLNQPPEELYCKFHRSCVKQRINRSLNSNLTLVAGRSEEDILEFYRLYVQTRKRVNLPPMPVTFFKHLWSIFARRKQIELHLAQLDGKAIAGQILFKFHDRVSVEFAAGDSRYYYLSPNHFLFWNAINKAWQQGYKVFDFGRTSPWNRGLMAFKSHWATQAAPLQNYYYSHSHVSQKYPEQKLTYAMVQHLTKITPLPLITLLGRVCYRHLG